MRTAQEAIDDKISDIQNSWRMDAICMGCRGAWMESDTGGWRCPAYDDDSIEACWRFNQVLDAAKELALEEMEEVEA